MPISGMYPQQQRVILLVIYTPIFECILRKKKIRENMMEMMER